jgi:hypothetical protein
MTREGHRSERFRSYLNYYPGINLEALRKITKILIRIISIPTDNLTGHLPNTI